VKLEEVPQDKGMIDRNRREVCYAVDKDGHYVMAPSAGWSSKKVANDQAWHMIREKVDAVTAKVRAGELSPLAYHMARNQMNVGLLAKYVRYSRLRVWWHLRPKVFERLSDQTLKPYAELFDIEIIALKKVPNRPCTDANTRQAV
jgi:hypothetical protein